MQHIFQAQFFQALKLKLLPVQKEASKATKRAALYT